MEMFSTCHLSEKARSSSVVQKQCVVLLLWSGQVGTGVRCLSKGVPSAVMSLCIFYSPWRLRRNDWSIN